MDRRLLRFTIGSLVAVLAVSLLYRFQQRQRLLEGVLLQWDESGVIGRHTNSRLAADRQTDPHRARLALARTLLADSLDLERLASLSSSVAAEEALRTRERLTLVQQIARDALAQRPSSWEAATLLGGARWIDRIATGGDPSRNADHWEDLLDHARQLSPRSVEPKRLRTISDLTRWHTLSDDQRTAATEAVRDLLGDTKSLGLLLPGWMAIADRNTLFDSLPNSTLAWSRVNDELARQGRWSDYCEAHETWNQLLLQELEETLTEATLRLKGGDSVRARQMFIQVMQRSRPGQRSAEFFDRALNDLPPGPISPSAAPALQAWADWGLALWTIEVPGLSPASFRRLAASQDLLSPESTAHAWLAAGDLLRAESIEQRMGESWSEAWAPYLMGKSRVLAEAGRIPEARSALGGVHRSVRRSPMFLVLSERLALETEEPPPSSIARDRWAATDWSWSGREISLIVDLDPRLLGQQSQTTLEIVIDSIQPEGSPIELQWDGRELGCRVVQSGEALSVPVDLLPGRHRLQVKQPVGGTVKPGVLRMRPPSMAEGTPIPANGNPV